MGREGGHHGRAGRLNTVPRQRATLSDHPEGPGQSRDGAGDISRGLRCRLCAGTERNNWWLQASTRQRWTEPRRITTWAALELQFQRWTSIRVAWAFRYYKQEVSEEPCLLSAHCSRTALSPSHQEHTWERSRTQTPGPGWLTGTHTATSFPRATVKENIRNGSCRCGF